MKPFWDNLFYDLDEGNLDQEGFAEAAGAEIRNNLSKIEGAIKRHHGWEALQIIDELKEGY